MASQVPLVPGLEAQPQVEPMSRVGVETPIAAFGGATADAISHMGEVVEGAGKEMFARAMDMQGMVIEGRVNSGLADYQNDLFKMENDFAMKYRGPDAASHLDELTQQSEQLRQKYAGSMGSPEGARQFDMASRNARFRTMFNSAGYAREEAKRFVNESAKGAIQSTAESVAKANEDGWDPVATQKAVDQAREIAAQNNETNGIHKGTPLYDQNVLEGGSHVLFESLRRRARIDPFGADKVKEDMLKKGMLSSKDAQDLDPIIQSQKLTVGSRNTAVAVQGGQHPVWDTYKITPSNVQEVLHGMSGTSGYESIGKEDPNGNGHPVGYYGVPSSELSRWLKEAGMPAMSEEEFLKDHDAQDKLAMFKFPQLQQQYGSGPEAMKVWASGIDTDNRVATGRQAMAETAPEVDAAGKAREAARRADPHNAAVEEVTSEALKRQRANAAAEREADVRRDSGIVNDALLGVGGKGGKLPTDPEEFKADPRVEDAYERLIRDPRAKALVDKALLINAAKGGYDFTAASAAQFEELRGVAANPYSTPAERDVLLRTDAASLPMPLSARQEIRKAQQEVAKGAFGDPNMKMALKAMEPILAGYKIGPTIDKARYNRFVGAFHDALYGFGAGRLQQVKDPEEAARIGVMILKSMGPKVTVHPLGFTTIEDQALFENAGDSAQQRLAAQVLQQKYGRPATAQEINNLILQQQMEMLGGQATKPKVGK